MQIDTVADAQAPLPLTPASCLQQQRYTLRLCCCLCQEGPSFAAQAVQMLPSVPRHVQGFLPCSLCYRYLFCLVGQSLIAPSSPLLPSLHHVYICHSLCCARLSRLPPAPLPKQKMPRATAVKAAKATLAAKTAARKQEKGTSLQQRQLGLGGG